MNSQATPNAKTRLSSLRSVWLLTALLLLPCQVSAGTGSFILDFEDYNAGEPPGVPWEYGPGVHYATISGPAHSGGNALGLISDYSYSNPTLRYPISVKPEDGNVVIRVMVRPPHFVPETGGGGFGVLAGFQINNDRWLDSNLRISNAQVFFEIAKQMGHVLQPSHYIIRTKSPFSGIGHFLPGQYHEVTTTVDWAAGTIEMVITRPDGISYTETWPIQGNELQRISFLGGSLWLPPATRMAMFDDVEVIMQTPRPVMVVEGPSGETLDSDDQAVPFTDTVVGEISPPRVHTIRNTGPAPLLDLALAVAGDHAGDFAVEPLSETSLEPGESVTFAVVFAPSGRGLRQARVEISGSGLDYTHFLLNLAGAGRAPVLLVEDGVGDPLASGGSVETFPAVLSGDTSDPVELVLRNTGDADLTGLSWSLLGVGADDFMVENFSADSIGPGESLSFGIRFAPTRGGAIEAGFSIESNDEENSPFTLKLSGFGLSTDLDTSGDGMNDAAKYLLRNLGFDWETPQPELVNLLHEHAHAAGLFSQADLDSSRDAGRQEVLDDPTAHDLWTPDAISDLNLGGLMVRREGGGIQLRLQLQHSGNLNLEPFMDWGEPVLWNFTAPVGKEFFRVRAFGTP